MRGPAAHRSKYKRDLSHIKIPLDSVRCARVVTYLSTVGLKRSPGLAVRVLFILQPLADLRQEDPLNLNILLSGGKETNKDSPSNGE